MNTTKKIDEGCGQLSGKQLWIGVIEVRPMPGTGRSEILGDKRGAFVNIVTWASDAQQYRENAELLVAELGRLFVAEVINPEPVQARRVKSGGTFEDEIEDMISRAQNNPEAIIFGTFHTFDKDDA